MARAARVLGRLRDLPRDGLEPGRGRRPRVRGARRLPRAARVPVGAAGHLPEARQRRARVRRRRRCAASPPDEPRIYFAKAFVHPLIAAPFVRAAGEPRPARHQRPRAGASRWLCAYASCAARASPGRALLAATVLLLATVAPVYLVWPTPELVTLALVMGGLSAWRSGHPLLAAVAPRHRDLHQAVQPVPGPAPRRRAASCAAAPVVEGAAGRARAAGW